MEANTTNPAAAADPPTEPPTQSSGEATPSSHPTPQVQDRSLLLQAGRGALSVAAVLLLLGIVRYAWISDDGFISARSLANVLGGHGLVLNIGDRVQTFTSALWVLLCLPLYALIREPYYCLMAAGLLCSLGLTLLLALSGRQKPWETAGVLVVLTASSSFLIYSTAGLENPLGHLLLAVYFLAAEGRWRHLRGARWLQALALGLLLLVRLDYSVLLLPHAAWYALRQRGPLGLGWRPTWRWCKPRGPEVLALSPLALWSAFALFYYGALLPNTAYAKLNTTIPWAARAASGVMYLVDVVYRDPLPAVALVLGFIALFARQVPAGLRLLFLGTLIHCVYLLEIGGDFMSGRFITAPLLVALLCLSELRPMRPALLSLGFVAIFPVIGNLGNAANGVNYGTCAFPHGITDERACYVPDTGLLENIRGQKWRTHGYIRDFHVLVNKGGHDGVVQYGVVGIAGFSGHDDIHIVEPMALSEPLLARTVYHSSGQDRPGHYPRPIPKGYLATLRKGKNLLRDPCLKELYDRLWLATRAPLFAPGRFRAIWDLNTTHQVCDIAE